MLIAGLTGGLACGKSFVGAAFGQLGCHVVEADQLGHDVMRAGGEARQPVIDTFGEAIIDPEGEINRSRLAQIVFSDSTQLSKLNAIIHPAVRLRALAIFDELRAQDPHGIAIYIAAILVETGSARDFEKLIVVNCTREQQIERSFARGASEADILARLDRQLPIEKKLALADYVIDASGSKEETLRQTKMVYDKLRELSR